MIPASLSHITPQPLSWLSAFAVGESRVDGEHRALIDLANEVCGTALRRPKPGVLRAAARELIAVVEAHFESEEALFPSIGYPGASDHVRAHLAIVAELNLLFLDGEPLDPPVAAATARLLLLEHILRHDMGIKNWVELARGD